MAPSYSEEALAILQQKKNIRLLQIDEITARREKSAFDMKKVYGGLLVQQYDESLIKDEDYSLFNTKAQVNTVVNPDGKEKTTYGCGVVTDRAPTKEERNNAARILLDYGFANFALFEKGEEYVEEGTVLGGVKDGVALYRAPFSIVVEKASLSSIEEVYEIPENLSAPIEEKKPLGRVTYMLDGNRIGFSEIYAKESIQKINLVNLFSRILKRIICG